MRAGQKRGEQAWSSDAVGSTVGRQNGMSASHNAPGNLTHGTGYGDSLYVLAGRKPELL
jgi:hypothetical protein